MSEIKVPYGKGFQRAEIPEDIKLEIIDIGEKVDGIDEESLLKDAMDNPIASPRLEEMVSKEDRILIVINDHTRPGPNRIIAREVLARLNLAKVPKKNIKFIVATGSHRRTTDEELEQILGSDIVSEYEILVHDCKDKDNIVYIGESILNVPIYINKALTESTFCIVTGLISPHHSAGYSGGRKSIVPGLAGFEMLKIHHSLPIRPYEPAMGIIYGNPFHEVALDVARKIDTKFMVNAVQNPHKQNIAFVAGDLEEAHKKGVDICKKISQVELEEKADIIVASPGGHPRDRNLYQAQKALSVAEMISNPNCTFILVAECRDGYGEGVLREWLKAAKDPQEVVDRFKVEGYDVGSNKAFMFARAMLKGEIIIVSDQLNQLELRKMMLGWAPSLQAAMDRVLKVRRPNKISVLPNAVNIIPKIIKEEVKK